MLNLRIIAVFLGLLVSPLALPAQGGISQKQQERKLAKKGKEEKKKTARAEKEGHKRHLAIQDKETRKRLKRQTRRADKRGSGSHRERGIGLFRRKR